MLSKFSTLAFFPAGAGLAWPGISHERPKLGWLVGARGKGYRRLAWRADRLPADLGGYAFI